MSSQDSQLSRSLVRVLITMRRCGGERFMMVRIPIGSGSKTMVVMVVYAHPGRCKEANQQNQHTVGALAERTGNSPLMICGDLQHEPNGPE